jgi:hypothetical protein
MTTPLLHRYISGDRPSLTLTIYSRRGSFKRTFTIQRDILNVSSKLRALLPPLAVDDAGNDPADGRKRKRSTSIRTGDLVSNIDIDMAWILGYEDLCPTDSVPMEWFLMHLAAFHDNPDVFKCEPSTAAPKPHACPVQHLINTMYPLDSDLHTHCCTGMVNRTIAAELTILLSLLTYFECHESIREHICNAIVYHMIHSDTMTTTRIYDVLATLLPPSHNNATFRLICAAASSLFLSTTKTSLQYLSLIPPPFSERSVHSQLQTVLTVHGNIESDTAATVPQMDIADFLDGFRCEFLLNDLPLLHVIDMEENNGDHCVTNEIVDERCLCRHITEAVLIPPPSTESDYTFAFGLARSHTWIDTLISTGVNETIKLRSLDVLIDISLVITKRGRLRVQVTLSSTRNINKRPHIELDVGVVNVEPLDTLNCNGPDMEGSLMSNINHGVDLLPQSSDAIHLDNTNRDNTDEEVTNTLDVISHGRTHRYVEMWSLPIERLLHRHFDDPMTDDIVSRLFVVRGSVRFCNDNFDL